VIVVAPGHVDRGQAAEQIAGLGRSLAGLSCIRRRTSSLPSEWGMATRIRCSPAGRRGNRRGQLGRRIGLSQPFAIAIVEVAAPHGEIVDVAGGQLARDLVDLAADLAQAIGQLLIGVAPAAFLPLQVRGMRR
jgi:hypothetical protein